MDHAGVLPVKAVEVMHNGCPMCPFPTLSSLSSEHAGWDGIAMESFTNVPPVAIPDHDHPTHFINLLYPREGSRHSGDQWAGNPERGE